VLDWFHARGITDEVLVRNRVDHGRVFVPELQAEVEAMIVPYLRAGELVNRKYRAFAEKAFCMDPGCELVLYGLDDIDPARLIWVEGELDKLALEVAGYRSVVSVPNGAPAIRTKNFDACLRYLATDHDCLEAVQRHVLALDTDEPGLALEAELARRLGHERCARVRWPEGCKDANDLLRKHGVEEVQWYIEHATPYPIEGAVGIDDYREEILQLYEQGRPRGVSTGWKTLDTYYRVFPGQLTVVTGIPGSGKSNWLDCLLVNLARLHDWRFALFSPENLPLEQHMAEMAAKYRAQPFYEGPTPRMTPAERDAALAWVAEHFSWIMPQSEDDWRIEHILEIAAQLCFRAGIRGVVIDPWNELESLKPVAMTETEYVSHVLKRVRIFARQRAVHVWMVVHPQKLYRDKNGKYPIPTLYDCAGSANFRNKADNGLVVWRDLSIDDRDEVELHVQKIRFRHVGKRGKCPLYYNSVCATYDDQRAGGEGAARGRERFEL
jgi:twinkle protein